MSDGLSVISISTLAQTAPPVAGGGGPTTNQPVAPGTTGAPGSQPLGPNGGQGAAPPGGFGMLFPLMLAFLAMMIVTSVMGSRKEKRKRAELLGSLARYDRVLTTGGVIGTVVELKDDEVVLKVDESTNAKIHFSRSAVQSILRKGKEGKRDTLEPAETAA